MQRGIVVSMLGTAALALGCSAHEMEAPSVKNPAGPQADGGSGTYVSFSVRGMTFTTGGGFSTDRDRRDCTTTPVGWIVNGTGHPATQILACQEIAPGGGGEYLNGGQVQVNGTVGSTSGYLASVSGDLRTDFTTVDFPSNGTVEFYGQAADGNCTFDQWRISTGGPVTSSTQNPMTLTPVQGHQIVGWFICSSGGGGGFAPVGH